VPVHFILPILNNCLVERSEKQAFVTLTGIRLCEVFITRTGIIMPINKTNKLKALKKQEKYNNGKITETNIINTCKKLFWKKGYRNTTYTDICSKVNIHPGSITHHFKSKNNIARIIFDDLMNIFYEKTFELFPDEDKMQQVIVAMGMYQKLLFLNANFRRFTAEYSSELIHAIALQDYVNTASQAYQVTVEKVGKKKADFLFTAYKGMDCYIEPYINEHIDELTFEDIFEYISGIYYQFLPEDELKSRLERALKSLEDVTVECKGFDFLIVRNGH
jgi:AcrR family transcriptional regulator